MNCQNVDSRDEENSLLVICLKFLEIDRVYYNITRHKQLSLFKNEQKIVVPSQSGLCWSLVTETEKKTQKQINVKKGEEKWAAEKCIISRKITNSSCN